MLKNKLNKKKKKGFTLIELIVVLAVLAIIALIAIPNFNQIRENSKIKSDNRGADLIDKAVTTLVLDGSIKNDGVYKFDGDTVTPGTAIPAVPAVPEVPPADGNPGKPAIPAVPAVPAGAEPDMGLITAVMDKSVIQQELAAADKYFEIIIRNTATAEPLVEVKIGEYSSDSLDK